jgi:hypothetical protein
VIAGLAAAAAALLIVPAGAWASTFFRGPVGDGSNNAGVEFRPEFKHDKPRKVLEFRWFNVPVPPQCTTSFEGTHFSMQVDDNQRFHGRYDVPNAAQKAIVHGRFKHHHRKAVGTIKVKGNFAGGCVDASTGKLHWTAKKPHGG